MTTVVIVGDVGGCADQLAAVLPALVEDPEAAVIQVGDLVDRGPDSPGVLKLVGERLAEAPERWIQLIGNHEAQYLGVVDPFTPEPLAAAESALLNDWWLRDRMRVAAAVRTAQGEELLVTHAGLTVGSWRELGSPVTAATTAELLNTRPDALLRSFTGPLWADAGPELYEGWLGDPAFPPFGQVHGHDTIVDFEARAWRCGERIRQRTSVDWAARHTTTVINRTTFIGVDPKHGRRGAPEWSPLYLRNATLLT
ncbi:metallophosphoesterase [Catenuloplanes japonicus]|uniref:metallophosphoesterase n=1 Tax=Catenuloplanes japonicus TaxID=33876 RepID=UPI000526437D|nr:metallophosphoesterase [Catenuloplanes japonicus]